MSKCKAKIGFNKQQIKEIKAILDKALSPQEFVDVLQGVVNEVIKTAMGELAKKTEQIKKSLVMKHNYVLLYYVVC